MNRRRLTSIVSLALCASTLTSFAAPHGGVYHGPGDTVPPGGGGGGGGAGPAATGPGGASPAPAAGPGVPSARTPGAGRGGTVSDPRGGRTRGVTPEGPDLSVWQFWWGFNQAPYLDLRRKVHESGVQTGSDEYFLGQGQQAEARDSMRPSERQIRGIVVPALLETLEKERNNDIITGAMVALAKIGDAEDESGESAFEKVIAKFLSDGNQEIAETAALALGILANEASAPTLVALLRDTDEGHRLVGSTEVPYRTRAFAAYGLGLIAAATSDNALRQDIAEQLVDVLEAPHFATRDIKVAAMTALGLCPIDSVPGETPAQGEEEASGNRHWVFSRETQIAYLLDYFEDDLKYKDSRHWFVRAHAPTAMARLLDGAPRDLKQGVARALLDSIDLHSKEPDELQQSTVLALGTIGDSDQDPEDERIRRTLFRVAADGDQQSRRFALVAMAQVGGRPGDRGSTWEGVEDVRAELLGHLSRGKTQMKPWAGLAIGVLERAILDNQHPAGMSSSMVQALRDAAADCKRPDEVGAFLIGLGLLRDAEARAMVERKMDDFQGSDEARGYAAVGLGLMDQRASIQAIQEVVKKSKYRPDLLKQAAVALGLLGDKDLVPELLDMLAEARSLATQAALAGALGAIGDARSIDPLVEMLQREDLTETARGFAAVALGIVCDAAPLPWVSKISTGINYRANTVSLTGEGGTGVLDLL